MYRGQHARRRWYWTVLTWAAAAALVLLLLYPFLEPYRLEVEPMTLTSTQLPEFTHGLRIVFVSDIHMGGWPWYHAGRLRGLVSEINRQKPDLVLLGGDYGADPEQTLAFFGQLPAISANLGVYAVLGECDRPAASEEDGGLAAAQAVKTLRDVMEARSDNIRLLVNEAVTVPFGSGRIRLVGLDEPQNGSPEVYRTARQVDPADYVILLAHNPSLIEDAIKMDSRDWFDLALFGHTHGNQFFGSFNPLGLAVDKDNPIAAGHRKGWLREGHNTPILISRGVGTAVLPVRVGCVPQIHRIDVQRGD